MRIDVISIFPEYLEPLKLSLVGKAIERGQVELHLHDLREHAIDIHRSVDDSPYGGGPGMVMKADVWGDAIDAVIAAGPHEMVAPLLVVPTPTGDVLTQQNAQELSEYPWLIFCPARYEGMDARVVDFYRGSSDVAGVLELSIGDYVLAGGEAAVLVMVEAAVRLLSGVLGNEASPVDDSFAAGADGLLAAPVYTRPPVWRGMSIPEILVSGDHAKIATWRKTQGLQLTEQRRPDLIARTAPADASRAHAAAPDLPD
jgi:tRNA (guanine37-N1)-methyltransferase